MKPPLWSAGPDYRGISAQPLIAEVKPMEVKHDRETVLDTSLVKKVLLCDVHSKWDMITISKPLDDWREVWGGDYVTIRST